MRKEERRALSLAPSSALTLFTLSQVRGEVWLQTGRGWVSWKHRLDDGTICQASRGKPCVSREEHITGGQSRIFWQLYRGVEGTAYSYKTVNDKYAQTSVGARDRYRHREAEGMAVGDWDIEPGPGPQTEAEQGRAGQRLRHGSRNPLSAPHQEQVEITFAVVISSDRDWFRAGVLSPGCTGDESRAFKLLLPTRTQTN